jgi:hypothetical protein
MSTEPVMTRVPTAAPRHDPGKGLASLVDHTSPAQVARHHAQFFPQALGHQAGPPTRLKRIVHLSETLARSDWKVMQERAAAQLWL